MQERVFNCYLTIDCRYDHGNLPAHPPPLGKRVTSVEVGIAVLVERSRHNRAQLNRVT